MRIIKKYIDKFTKQVILIFFYLSIFNLLNLLFQLYMVRTLHPVEYGILNSLLSILVIISLPAGTIQTAITKFVSTFHAHGQLKKLKLFLINSIKKASILGLLIFTLIFFGSRGISSFLHIQSKIMVIMVGFIMFFSILLPINLGGLLGLNKYGHYGINMTFSGLLKLVISIILVSLGLNIMGALNGIFLSIIITFCLTSIFLKRSITSISNSIEFKDEIYIENCGNNQSKVNFLDVYKYIFPVAITSFGFMILTNIDIILVKHFFHPEDAGYYSIAQMVGRVILFLPGPIMTVMFPEIAKLNANSKDVIPTLRKSLKLVFLLCGIVTLVCFYFPSYILRILAKNIYPESIPLVFLFALSMTFFSLANTLSTYFLSINKINFIFPLILFVLLQLILILVFHNTMRQILYILCVISFLVFTSFFFLVKWKED